MSEPLTLEIATTEQLLDEISSRPVAFVYAVEHPERGKAGAGMLVFGFGGDAQLSTAVGLSQMLARHLIRLDDDEGEEDE